MQLPDQVQQEPPQGRIDRRDFPVALQQLADPVHQEEADHKQQNTAQEVYPGGLEEIDDVLAEQLRCLARQARW